MGLTKSTGCDLNVQRIWTSTPCNYTDITGTVRQGHYTTSGQGQDSVNKYGNQGGVTVSSGRFPTICVTDTSRTTTQALNPVLTMSVLGTGVVSTTPGPELQVSDGQFNNEALWPMGQTIDGVVYPYIETASTVNGDPYMYPKRVTDTDTAGNTITRPGRNKRSQMEVVFTRASGEAPYHFDPACPGPLVTSTNPELASYAGVDSTMRWCYWSQLLMYAVNGGHNDLFVRCCMDASDQRTTEDICQLEF